MKICFETFGCRLNRAEALQQEADAIKSGHTIVDNHQDADLIVIRGCSVTARAQRDCEQTIDHLKRKYPTTKLLVLGCLPIADKTPNNPISKILQTPDIADKERPTPTRTARAYLKVQDGCNSACAYCIVPSFRGKSVSVPFDQTLARARGFIAAGYREIVMTGCNLTQYADGGNQLPELVAAIAQLDPDVRLRLGSVEPGPVAMRLVDVMASHQNVCRFLHLSLQSGSNDILRKMKRPYFALDVDRLVEKAREKMPLIAIGCDVITGFNGESEMDFHATFGQIKRLKFAKAHVFPYSERPGTSAAKNATGSIPRETRRHRARLISDYMYNERAEFARKFIGKTVEIVVERNSKVEGWTSEYLWCKAVGTAPRKSMIKVFVTRNDGDVLCGRIVT